MSLTDIMKHLQILNLALQGTEKITSDLAQIVLVSRTKLKFSKRHNVKNFPPFFQPQNDSESLYKSYNRPQSMNRKINSNDCWKSFKQDLTICNSLSHALRSL